MVSGVAIQLRGGRELAARVCSLVMAGVAASLPGSAARAVTERGAA